MKKALERFKVEVKRFSWRATITTSMLLYIVLQDYLCMVNSYVGGVTASASGAVICSCFAVLLLWFSRVARLVALAA
jgi:hypothetical protein